MSAHDWQDELVPDGLDDDPAAFADFVEPSTNGEGSLVQLFHAATVEAASSDWPAPPHPDAYHGLIGDFVRAIEPHSESDPVALLVQALVAIGSVIGRDPHVRVEADEHPGRLNVALIGDSSRGRKGTSFGHVKRFVTSADPTFPDRIEGGLSSGEGLIDRVADPATDEEGNPIGPTVDKRLLIVETELASAFKVMERQGNTLSPVLRNAWDGTTLGTLTRNARLKATGTHISLVGHITTDEVRRVLNATEAANGFGNRFLWICARRSKLLPEGGSPDQVVLNGLSVRLRRCIDHARSVGVVSRDSEARTLWASIYEQLSHGAGGLAGALTARAEAQVTRLALLYALLDETDTIGAQHYLSALAVWDYSARSVVHIFGDSTGNPDADAILRALRATTYGLTRTEISTLFGRNITAGRIDQALAELLERDRAYFEKEATGGRPSERWRYGKRP